LNTAASKSETSNSAAQGGKQYLGNNPHIDMVPGGQYLTLALRQTPAVASQLPSYGTP